MHVLILVPSFSQIFSIDEQYMSPNGEKRCKYEQIIRIVPAMPSKKINEGREELEKVLENIS